IEWDPASRSHLARSVTLSPGAWRVSMATERAPSGNDRDGRWVLAPISTSLSTASNISTAQLGLTVKMNLPSETSSTEFGTAQNRNKESSAPVARAPLLIESGDAQPPTVQQGAIFAAEQNKQRPVNFRHVTVTARRLPTVSRVLSGFDYAG